MSTYTVEQLPGEPIVLFTAYEDYDLVRDIVESADEVKGFFDALDTPGFYIADVRHAPIDMEGMLKGASHVARSQEAVFHHANMEAVIAVVPNEI